ncbi:phage tail protein [Saccharothrix sp. ST-888]|uniref:phage tail protein n=1 Tax=Saccharothrix sp. ST-888 TaxID=1427391 RepID=UPI0005EBF7B7|nr:phage tail protein [Saccharothrix sp. ST-888]KJK59277.1 hypothetical protein UK12_05500 [Saccharothrix sp. ST-888]
MDGDRAISILADPDQWARCSHNATALLAEGGVGLVWDILDPAAAATPVRASGDGPAGLAFDRWGRAYRSRPTGGRVEVLDVATQPCGAAAQPGDPAARSRGAASHHPGALRTPRGLAIDGAQRLYIAESCGGAVHVVDLWAGRLLRRVPVRSAAHRARRPLDAAAVCGGAVVLLADPPGLVLLQGRRGPLKGPAVVRPPGAEGLLPLRVAASGSRVHLLWSAPGSPRAVLARADGSGVVAVAAASDLDLTADGTLVVACGPGRPFRRFGPDGASWTETEPLHAPGHDGGALAVAPDGRIAFTTADGLGWTAGSATRYTQQGSVVSYRLDSGSYRTRWGRLFVDACIPPGTDVRVSFLSSDEDEVPDPLPRTPAGRGQRAIRHPELTPPLPSLARLARLPDPAALFRRPTGREWPWAQIAPDDDYETYEAPVTAPPGRYLWIVLTLGGTARLTPRVRALRVEHPGHRLAAQLPGSWSRDEADADFLQRFLAPAEGILHELDGRAALRTLLLDPTATPQEALGWLAGLVGVVLDRRWTVEARRALVAQAYDLFRIRGTLSCLERILRIYLPVPVGIVENWRLRGLGGAVLGTAPGGPPAPAIGGAAVSAGALGHFTVGGQLPGKDGYSAAAHRFTVLIAAPLDGDRLDVVRSIVATHRPAHTLVDICPLGSGMRIGRSLHLDLTSVVGPGAAWGPAVLGHVLVGGDGVVGVPSAAARVGDTSIAGAVRVG